ncbi:MAG: hypothetical protein F6J90_42150 [Moorea sp. SIOASIH]|nr:hypothetical protein [Moorena sp. SIOASIH]NEO42572.1 hypothetical protein [Moorena sp. SIOASIH]
MVFFFHCSLFRCSLFRCSLFRCSLFRSFACILVLKIVDNKLHCRRLT